MYSIQHRLWKIQSVWDENRHTVLLKNHQTFLTHLSIFDLSNIIFCFKVSSWRFAGFFRAVRQKDDRVLGSTVGKTVIKCYHWSVVPGSRIWTGRVHIPVQPVWAGRVHTPVLPVWAGPVYAPCPTSLSAWRVQYTVYTVPLSYLSWLVLYIPLSCQSGLGLYIPLSHLSKQTLYTVYSVQCIYPCPSCPGWPCIYPYPTCRSRPCTLCTVNSVYTHVLPVLAGPVYTYVLPV